MVSLFKSNNPLVVIFYLLYLVLFRAYFFVAGSQSVSASEHTELLSNFLFGWLQSSGDGFAVLSIVFSGLLSFVQALFINSIVNSNKILPRKNYVAGALFLIVSSLFLETLYLSAAQCALTFLILCAGKIFALIKKEKLYGDVFDVGFLIAVATLFYFPALLFIVFAYFGLATVRPFQLREWAAVFAGFLAPFFLAFTYYFWFDIQGQLWGDILNQTGNTWMQMPAFASTDKILLITLGFMLLCCLFFLPGALYASLIQVRKFINVLAVFVLIVLASLVLASVVELSHFIFLALPLCIFLSVIFVHIKRNVIVEVIHIILLLLVLSMQFLPLFKII